jgi:POT family proton-dependent oligopeptide transporter
MTTTPPEKHPPGLYVLSSTEMWERFSFYSVQGMLVLYLKEYFQWEDKAAIQLYAWYTACVYASPLLGGWVADRYLGYRKSILIGGAFFITGHALFAVPDIRWSFVALGCLVVGNGFFKPNVSTMVGNLYPATSKLKDRAFSIFYMGINIGACAGPIVCELLKGAYGFHRAFNAAAVGMCIAMITFWSLRRHVPTDGERNEEKQGAPSGGGDAIAQIPELHRIVALVLVCAVGIVFWIIFWQNGSTLTLWADENTDWSFFTDRKVSGIISNAINPGFIILLGAPVAWMFKQLDRRGIEPSTPTKMALGLVCCTASMGVLYLASISGGNTGKVSPAWLFAAYALISLGEILLSAMGLSLVSKVAPPRFRGLLMGCWFLSISLGAKWSDIGVNWKDWSHSYFFAVLTGISAGAALVLFVMLRFLRKSMPGV